MPSQFTDKQVKALLKQAKAGRYAAGNGLYFRVSSEGTGFWVVRYVIHENRREITIGRYPEMSLADARAETTLVKRNIKEGNDPLAERKRSHLVKIKTVDQLAEDWLKSYEGRLKHPQIPRRVYTKDIAPLIGGLKLDQVTPTEIRAIIEKIVESGRPSVSNDSLMYCKQLFRHGIKLDLISRNPAEAFTVNDAGGVEQSRSRILTLDELKEVFAVLRSNVDQFSRENYLATALLVTLGVRKGELIAARWEEFDFEEALWHIPEERSKTGVAISVPLPSEPMEWFKELKIRAIDSEFVCPRRRSSKRFGHVSPDTLNAAIQKQFKLGNLQVSHFTIHDLRRTCRSLLSAEGVPGHVAERCLNHKLTGVEGIYDRYDYLDERRDGLSKIAKRLSPLINISPRN